MELEYKAFPFEVKEITDAGIVKGIAAAIGNVDDGGDRILPGAFDKSLARTSGVVPIYWAHEWDELPIGFGTEASADAKYLNVAGELTLANTDVADVYRTLQHAKKVGFTMGISIGYRVPPKGADFVENVRELREVDVFEWSITPFPMNKRARVTGIKSAAIAELTERDFERLLRDAGLSARDAKAVISRGFRSLKAEQRDVAPDVELPPQLKQIADRLEFERGLAELRTLITT
jgi:uncharacterized protein